MSTPSFKIVEPGTPFRGSAQVFSPPWLLGPNGARYVFSSAIQWDTLAEMTRLGTLQRFPTLAQPDALPALGRDRKIWRGVTETDQHYAERLRKFKRTWKFAGNAPTLLQQLWELMVPDAVRIRYVVNGYEGAAGSGTQFADWWTIDDSGLVFERVSPSNWNWDGRFGKNVRFWLIVYRSDTTPAVWGEPPYPWGEQDLRWGSAPGASTEWIVDLYNIVSAFKAAGSHMGPFTQAYAGGLIIANASFTTAPWGADGPFPPSAAAGYPMPDGTFALAANRPPGAVYLSGI